MDLESKYEGASLINLRTSLSETTWKELIVGGSLSERRDLDGVCLKVSLIFLNFINEKPTKSIC